MARHVGIEERIGSDGKTSYRVKVRIKGFPPQTATFARVTDAIRWRQQVDADIRRGKYFQTAEARKHTFGDLVERYIATVLPRKPKSMVKQKAQLSWWRKQIGDRLLADISTSLIVELRDKLQLEATTRGEERSPSTVNRYLAVLSHAFSVAVHEWQWLPESPVRKLKQKEPGGRIRFLTPEESCRLLQACKESENRHLYTIVVLALSTGMRRSEITNLRFADVCLDSGRITLRETKNGHPRIVPLVGVAKSLLNDHSKRRRLDTDLVFPATKGHKPRPAVFRSAWEKALERADIKNFTFHCLRHTAASWLAMSGITGPVISEILGHRSSSMTKRYTHFADDHLHQAVSKMNDNFLVAGAS